LLTGLRFDIQAIEAIEASFLNPRRLMRKSHIAYLSAILAAGAICLPLLASTTSAFAASPRTTAPIGTQLAGLKGSDAVSGDSFGSLVALSDPSYAYDTSSSTRPQALSVGSVNFASSNRQEAMTANWTVNGTTSASGALAIGGNITISAPASTTFPSAAHAYSVNGTMVTAIPTTAAGTVTIATPVAVGDSAAISVVITGVTNPAPSTYANSSFSILTSTDTTASNPASGLSFGSVVSSVSFSPSSSVSSGSANWTVGFTTSANGALAIGDTITISAPASTTFPSASSYKVNGTTVTATPTTAAGTVTIATPVALGDSTPVSVQITGVTNPAANSYPNTAFSASTIADAAANPASGQAFSVGSVTTTTGLGLSLTSVAYGSETSEIFTVTVTGQSGDGYPEGTVAVYNSTTELCSATLYPVSSDSASSACALAASELAGGGYNQVFATYNPGTTSSSDPSYTYATSSSTPVQAFSVSSVNTTTGLGLSLTSVAYGSETSEIFTVTVTGQSGDGYPEGTVTVYNSTTKLCSATLNPVSSDSASATCSLTAYELAAGAYSNVFATYSPGIPSSSNASYTYATSSSSPVQALSVGKTVTTETTTTSLELSAGKITYGDEQVEQLSVSVSPQHSGTTPTGTVTISGANCQITLSSGKGSCTLPAAYFNAGNRQMVATYNGSSNFRRSASAKETITIAAATTTTNLELSATKVTYGDEQVEQLSVSVSPQYPGIRPTGTVTVSGANCQIGLSSGKGSCRLSPTQFGTGSRQMIATYNGNQNFRRSASAKQTIAVVK
jgi:hypothetical protein